MSMAIGRRVSLLVVDRAGAALGRLPAFDVQLPYWQDAASVVAAARERFGVEVTILRLLTTAPGARVGGDVTYLAEAQALPEAYRQLTTVDTTPHAHRPPYAHPGGPAASLRWAGAALAAAGRGPVLAAEQQRTWNLSSIWRLDTRTGPVWLKEVPPFFGHEPAVLRFVADLEPGLVPDLLAADGGRMLLEDVPGVDLYGAGVPVREAIAAAVHGLQAAAAGRTAELVAAGVPDRRARPLAARLAAVVAEHAPGDELLARFVTALPDRLAEVDACGVPATLVHGDLHPGNVRGPADGAGPHTVIDWGDSFVGHPAFDHLRLTGDLAAAQAAGLTAAWVRRWRQAVPGCDPERALALLRPVAALYGAAVYANFLANIEPDEYPYHAADVPDHLATARAAIAKG